jgi:hypothetical protein
MKRKNLLLPVLFLFAGWMQAETVPVEKALKVASRYCRQIDDISLRSSSEASLTLAYAAIPETGFLRSSTGIDAFYYVFNIGDKDGFVIVSGDDRAYPILGYSLKGAFDISNLPSNFERWLKAYQEEITFVVREKPEASPVPEWQLLENGSRLQSKSLRRAVEPLGTAEWNQGAPYNLECPMFGDARTMTGCVATAMAIVMKYHADHGFRAAGTGSHSYVWQGKTLSVNFGEYNWDNMSVKTDEFVDDSQRAAVARLMYHCGVGIEATYGVSETNAYYVFVVTALSTFFGYDENTEYVRRYRFTDAEWTTLLRGEIDNGRPVIYTGQREDDSGHAFVCEGYNDNDEYYMNWGWGGYSNGYFRLTALQPSINQNYVYNTGMIIGIQKSLGDVKRFSALRFSTDIGNIGMMKSQKVVQNEPFSVRAGAINNYSFTQIEGTIAVALMNSSGQIKEIIGKYDFELPPHYWIGSWFNCMATQSVAASDVLRIVYSEDNERTWKTVYGGTGITDVLGVNDEPSVFVEDISLNTVSRAMTVGETFQLTKSIYPSNATNQNAQWLSDNTSVATVSSSGLITATGAGTATITVRTTDGNHSATCTVVVTGSSVGTGQVVSPDVTVFFNESTLTVDSPANETVAVYDFSGQLLFAGKKPQGKTVFTLANPTVEKAVIVTGSSGWVKKIVR